MTNESWSSRDKKYNLYRTSKCEYQNKLYQNTIVDVIYFKKIARQRKFCRTSFFEQIMAVKVF